MVEHSKNEWSTADYKIVSIIMYYLAAQILIYLLAWSITGIFLYFVPYDFFLQKITNNVL